MNLRHTVYFGGRRVFLAALMTTLGACGGRSETSDSNRYAGVAKWASGVDSSQVSSFFSSVATDGSNNVYVAGYLSGLGSLEFGNSVTATVVSGSLNALLVKYDARGSANFAQTAATTSVQNTFGSVVVDALGNIYAAGTLNGSPGTVDFGNDVTLTKSQDASVAFLVKYDASGTAQWARAVTGANGSGFDGLALDVAGYIYAVGVVNGTNTYDFGNGVTVAGVATSGSFMNSPTSAFIVKYDASGAAQWAQSVKAGSPASNFASVAVDSEGNTYAAGTISGTDTYDFGNGATATGNTSGMHIAGEAGSNAVLVKFNASGTAEWARTAATGSHGSNFMSVAVDAAGNIYTAGEIGGPGAYDFGNGVTAEGSLNSNAFGGMAGPQYAALVKYDASGTAQWAKTVTDSGADSYFTSLTSDSAGNVYAAGTTYGPGPFNFGNGAAVPCALQGRNYPVLVRYDSAGNPQWARSSINNGSTDAEFYSVAADPVGNVYAAGSIGEDGLVDFGSGVTLASKHIEAGGGWSGLLVKYQ